MDQKRRGDDNPEEKRPWKKRMMTVYLNRTIQEDSPELLTYLPQEIRTTILEFLPSEHRFKYASCSFGCFKDMLHSLKSVRRLKFNVRRQQIEIRVQQDVWKKMPNKVYGFHLIFEQENEKNYMKFLDNSCCEQWRVTLVDSSDLMQIATYYLELCLTCFQHSVRELEIKGIKSMNFNAEITSFEQLQDLEVYGDLDVYQFVAKAGKYFNRLSAFTSQQNEKLPDCEQIHQISSVLIMPSLLLNSTQFEQITASLICIHIGFLTPDDIYDFLLKWQHGLLGKNIDAYTWCLVESNFNMDELLAALLSVDDPENNVCDTVVYDWPRRNARYVKIRLQSNPDIIGSLYFNDEILRFDTKEGRM